MKCPSTNLLVTKKRKKIKLQHFHSSSGNKHWESKFSFCKVNLYLTRIRVKQNYALKIQKKQKSQQPLKRSPQRPETKPLLQCAQCYQQCNPITKGIMKPQLRPLKFAPRPPSPDKTHFKSWDQPYKYIFLTLIKCIMLNVHVHFSFNTQAANQDICK